MRHIYFTGICLIAFCSCTNNNSELNQIEEKVFTRNCAAIKSRVGNLQHQLWDKKNSVFFSESIDYWLQVTKLNQHYSNNVIERLLSIKNNLPKAGTDSVKLIFNEYLDSLSMLNPNIKIDLAPYLAVSDSASDNKNATSDEYMKALNNNSTQLPVLINQMITDILLNEEAIIFYCNAKMVHFSCGYNKSRPVIYQNATHFKEGEKLKIIAGIGAFSSAAAPKININGKDIKIIDGATDYTITISGAVGKYHLPIKISFRDQNGMVQSTKSDIVYNIDK